MVLWRCAVLRQRMLLGMVQYGCTWSAACGVRGSEMAYGAMSRAVGWTWSAIMAGADVGYNGGVSRAVGVYVQCCLATQVTVSLFDKADPVCRSLSLALSLSLAFVMSGTDLRYVLRHVRY
eukprot:787340-Rhodomonas_salina.2